MAEDPSSERPQKRLRLHTSKDFAGSQEALVGRHANLSTAIRGSPPILARSHFGSVQGRNVIAGQNISGGTVNFNFHGELEGENRKYLEDLGATDPRHDKTRIEQTKGGLLSDSYRWVLDNADFRRWREDEQSRLLWIKGDPGKGKTMLLCGIINELKSAPDFSLLSFFFCQATDRSINSATAILRGLIYLLVDQDPSLISHVKKKYDTAGNPLFREVNAWVALLEMFNDILGDPCLPPTCLVIDALDECTTGLDLLLDLIVQTSSVYSGVKWIVSSRNWPSIEKHLNTATQKTRLSLELNEKSVSTAVTAYIRFKVEELAKHHEYNNNTRDAVERYLAKNAYGTFLWVALVCQELAKTPAWKTQKKLAMFPPGLDALYRRMMNQISNFDDAEDTTLCKHILAIVSSVYRPITIDELVALVDTLDDVSGDDKALAEIIGLCGSFLTLRERTISFVHQSAKDFLLKEAYSEIFPSRMENIHYAIFSRSLKVIQKILRRDIYNLSNPGYSIDQITPPNQDPLASVQYSCIYWVNHLRDCDPKKNASRDLQDGGLVDTFLREKYLYWLEALSLLKRMSEGVASMLELEDLIAANKDMSCLIDRVQDACRFSLYHKWAIENSPLQVYLSALIFSPGRCITRSEFENAVPQWITQKPTIADNWSACLQTLEGHSGPVTSVAWSHNATRLVSASNDYTVKIWDPATGQCVSTFEDHSGWVTSVAWSHDATRLVSASDDWKVKIWDPATGQCVSTLEDHSGWVTSVAWSHDATRLASASNDCTVKIWDPATGQCVSTFEGHSEPVKSIAWSHDATRLASASKDCTVKIWDPVTGQCVSALEGHSGWVTSIAWSHDATRLASASTDWTVKIWDPANGQCVSTFEGHSDSVNSIAWAHDATRLVSASDDYTVKIWDPATGQCVSTFEGHSGWVTSVAWSHDTTRLASASNDCTVKIWDPATGQCVSTLEGHSKSVNSIALSYDATRLVSASNDCTVKIWDPATGQCVSTLEGHSKWVTSIAWSHDATRLVSASDDWTVKIWDPATGQCVSKLESHSGRVTSVAWSHDATRLASASNDCTVKIWNPATGQCVSTFKGHSMWVTSVAWSHDATRLASASNDCTVKIWDPATGQCVSTLEGHSMWVTSVAWSYDATRLASASNDWTVKIWDPATGQCVSTLEICRNIGYIQFHKSNSDLLHTKSGTLDLGHVANLLLGRISADPLLPKVAGYGLSNNNTWITYQGENLIWLPPEYRPLCFAVSGTTVSIGCSSGHVLIFKFSDENPIL